MNIGIVGITGAVGYEMLYCMGVLEIKIKILKLFASNKSAGTEIKFKEISYIIHEVNELSILKGGAKTFMDSRLRSVFIEVDTSQPEYSRVLDNYGFKLNRKQKNNENDRFENQVWEKSESL